MDILIGTKNPYKIDEINNLIKGLKNIKIHYLDEIKNIPIIEENQKSLKGNAEKKAIGISNYTDYFVLASDGGVDIPKLKNKWNVLKNQRIVGENKTDQEKVDFLINLMKNLKEEDRKCIDYFALAIAKNGQLIWSFEDIYNYGYIIEKPNKKEIPKGRWMSSVWFYPQFQKTYLEINKKELTEINKYRNNLKSELQKCIKNII